MRLSDHTFSQWVVVLEEFADPQALHYDFSLEFVDNLVESVDVVRELLACKESRDQVQSLLVFDVVFVGAELANRASGLHL